MTRLIEVVSSWLRADGRANKVPGGRAIAREFVRFQSDLPAIAARNGLELGELTFRDLRSIATEWILAETVRS